jgi:Large ribosomal RNA subunit accumulation protein YceD
MQPVTRPEFSRFVRIDDLPPTGRSIVVAASAHEREALARRLSLAGLARLEVAGEVMAIRGGSVIRLTARLLAEVTQTCVVTLAPLERRIETDFVRLYAADAVGEAAPGEEVFFDEEDEDIEALIGNRIDAGEAAAEQLALELDPYPRAAGASLAPGPDVGGSDREEGEGQRSHPFAGLAALAEQAAARKQSK